MNVFELSVFATPLAGAISGSAAAEESHIFGGFIGLLIGAIVCVIAFAVSALFSRVPGVMTKTEGLNPIQWVASFLAVVAPAAAPIGAIFLARVVTESLTKL